MAEISANPPPYLTVSEAAYYTRMGERNLRAKSKARLLPFVKIGGKVLYRRAGLDEAIKRLEIHSVT